MPFAAAWLVLHFYRGENEKKGTKEGASEAESHIVWLVWPFALYREQLFVLFRFPRDSSLCSLPSETENRLAVREYDANWLQLQCDYERMVNTNTQIIQMNHRVGGYDKWSQMIL